MGHLFLLCITCSKFFNYMLCKGYLALNWVFVFEDSWVYCWHAGDWLLGQFDPAETYFSLGCSRWWAFLALDVAFLDPQLDAWGLQQVLFTQASWNANVFQPCMASGNCPPYIPVAILCPTRSYFAPHSLVFSQRSKISGAPSPCNSLLCKCPNPPILDTLTPSNPISVSSAPRDHCCLLGLRFVFLRQSLENAPRVNVLFPFFGRSQPLLSVVYCLDTVAPYILSSLVIFMLEGESDTFCLIMTKNKSQLRLFLFLFLFF